MIKMLAGIILIGAVTGFLLWGYANDARPPSSNPYGCSTCAGYCPAPAANK